MSIEDRQISYAEKLANIPVVQVAQIAATVMNDDKGPEDATREAYSLLEIAHYCNDSLRNERSYATGIASFKESVKSFEDLNSKLAERPGWEYEIGEDGNKLPVAFETGLAALIPKPGAKGGATRETRMARFKEYLTDIYRRVRPDQDALDGNVEVAGRIVQMEKVGISPEVFDRALLEFAVWWQSKKTEMRSISGKKWAEAKKTKPRREEEND